MIIIQRVKLEQSVHVSVLIYLIILVFNQKALKARRNKMNEGPNITNQALVSTCVYGLLIRALLADDPAARWGFEPHMDPILTYFNIA